MNAFDALDSGRWVQGLAAESVQIVRAQAVGPDALELVYKDASGRLHERLLFQGEADALQLLPAERIRNFAADSARVKLVSEALRIRLAHLFDPFLALSSSQIEALPHQITAVYGEMLGRQPLRFLLADDPGAGKTVMAGLLIKELYARAELERVLIVCPGGLVEQWQDELHSKFDLTFEILGRERLEGSGGGRALREGGRWIARMDMLSRSEELTVQLEEVQWDLVIVDEAHRMAAAVSGNEVKYTKRFKLGERLGEHTRHLLLMTATPHNGKDADFHTFMSLLDPDRFAGTLREGSALPDSSDLIRRVTKENLVRFDGRPLFPERRSSTVSYPLSTEEQDLYDQVTDYVREEMNRADRLDEGRRVNVGFALTALQRRLASSPEAIYQSLRRRHERLSARLREEVSLSALESVAALEDPEEWSEAETEALENRVLDRATAARTVQELEAELETLARLEAQALRVRSSGQDAKWGELRRLLEDPVMTDSLGKRRKLIIFSEARDTLYYLLERIGTLLGKPAVVETIHGGVSRDERRRIVERFNFGGELKILVANDAAGEGLNLQTAHLMVNYDLPWNPNRLEQRFGRIHRIGQEEVCFLWNLVAQNTREGEVYQRLLLKLEAEARALGGQVFDVLGRLFEHKPLRELLLEAIRYGDQPEVRARLQVAIEGAVDRPSLERLLNDRALGQERLDLSTLQDVREQMERAAARRLQPHFIGAFFLSAFTELGGRVVRREAGRHQVTHVPARLRERATRLTPRDAVLNRYERICFDKNHVRLEGHDVALIAPGHPLLDHTLGLILEEGLELLAQGSVLIDPQDARIAPRVLVYLEHTVRSAQPQRDELHSVVSQKLLFLERDEAGSVWTSGPAPYLDYRVPSESEVIHLAPLREAKWLTEGLELPVLEHAIREVVPQHLAEVRSRVLPRLDKIEREVKARLSREINYWDTRSFELRAQEKAGKTPRINSQNAHTRAQNLQERLERRMARITLERTLSAGVPQVRGVVLVVPQGWLNLHVPSVTPFSDLSSEGAVSSAARARVELAAMRAVMQSEEALGRVPRDMSAQRGLGYDLESRDPVTGKLYFVEVKGRHPDADTVTLTKNEILASRNVPDAFRLALVRVEDGVALAPRYLSNFPFPEPAFAEVSRSFRLADLEKAAGVPH